MPKDQLRIACISGFAAYWGKYPADVLDRSEGMTVGGGEENFLRSAVGLRALGHEVDAWHYGEAGHWRGVNFRSMQQDLYKELMTGEYDAVACWSAIAPLERVQKRADGTYPHRLFVQQLNDLCIDGDWSRVDCIVSPSKSHAEQLASWGWKSRPHAVVHNGCDTWMYGDNGGIKPGTRGLAKDNSMPLPPAWETRPMNVGYWSSPDRGLHHLLKVWPKVTAQVPDAKLHVFYEIDRYMTISRGAPGPLGDRARLLAQLVPAAKADPSIVFHGAVPRLKLREIQVQTRVMAYPYQPVGYCEGFCFPPGTLVNTLQGHKPVEKLTLSDKVQGKLDWRAITALKTRMFEGKMVRINPACGEAVEMTDDHPVFASEDGKHFDWLHADKVKPGMWLYSAAPKIGGAGVESVRTPRRAVHPAHVGKPENFGGKLPIVLPDALTVTPSLCRLLGYFVGDGNAPNRGRTAATASLFFGSEQKYALVDDAVACIKEVFGVEPKNSLHATKKMVTVQLQSAAVAHALGSWCYAEDGKRMLPEWAMNLSLPHTEELLKGLWRTDGSVVEQEGVRFAGFTSSSPYLIAQVRTLLSRLGRRVRIQQRVHKTGKVSWSMYFSIAGAFLDYGSVQREEQMHHHYARPLDGGAFALRVREVTSRPYKGLVHALTVDVDESHHVGNFLVHNCGSVNQGIAAGCHVLTTPYDALPSLYDGAVGWLPAEPEQMERELPGRIVDALTAPYFEASPSRYQYSWERSALEMEKACLGENWETL